MNFKPVFAVTLLACAMLFSSGAGPEDYRWYDNLIQPKFKPPRWVFGPVWTILYLLIGAAFYTIWENRNQKHCKLALYLFALHLVANFTWSNIFFKQHNIKLALYDLAFMWASLLIIMAMTIKLKSVIWLLLPYLIWLTYALFLNFTLFKLN